MTTDAASLALEQAYAKFPRARIARTGVSEATLDALETSWGQQSLSWRYQQGLAIAASPDEWVAAEVGAWPPPVALPLTVYVGDNPPVDPPDDALWWSKATESLSRFEAGTAEWVPESSTAAGTFVPLSILSVAGGVATLDADGKLVSAQIPRFVIGQTFVVASQAEMLALDAHLGDIAKRTDQGGTVYMLTEEDPSALGNWLTIGSSSADVASVNGQTGAVTLGPADVGTDAAGTPRPPTAHSSSHSAGGTDALTPGAIGSDAAGTARPPLAHKANHATGGSDAISPSDIGALTRVFHGAVAGTLRPTGVTGPVAWFGTVAPTNAATNDVWCDQANSLWKRWNGTTWIALGTTTLPDSSITVDPTGLIIVQGSDTNVHSVISRLDGAINGKISQVRAATDVDWSSVSATTPVLAYNAGADKIKGVAAPSSLAKQHIVGSGTSLPGTAGANGAVTDITGLGFSLDPTPSGADQWVQISGTLLQNGGVQTVMGSPIGQVFLRLLETTGGGSVNVLGDVGIPLAQNSAVALRNFLPLNLQFWIGAIASTRTFKWQAFTSSPAGLTVTATVAFPTADTWQR